MRHSRRLSNYPNQPQGPFCTNCAVNLSTFAAYIRCADPACSNIPICIDCFSVGAAQAVPHKPNHPYRIIEKLAQPIYAADWAAHEEVRLLEALSEHGPHHWKAVADYVGKTQRKCELHYDDVYLKGPNAPFATSHVGHVLPVGSPATSADGLDDADAHDCKPPPDAVQHTGNQRKLKNKDSEPESGTLEGFMPLRGDFDVEWDDKAEELISDLVIDPTDTPEERQLKTRLLTRYDERLQRRNAVKEFLFDRKLLDFSELKYNDRRGSRDEKELSARLQVFSRLLSKPEFDAFYSSVMTEYRISRDVYRMAQARKMGIRTKAELDIYEVERKARCQRLSESEKAKGNERVVEKRMRSSLPSHSLAPKAAPQNNAPSSPVLSPAKIASAEDGVPGETQGGRHSLEARRARERKRIARSPYPILEAIPVNDMDHAWKLSETERKLCSALQIPPAEFLRMRDAMLYTATQNVKRRGRPRKRGSNNQLLTIRAKRQQREKSVTNRRNNLTKTPRPSVVLDSVPILTLQQQRASAAVRPTTVSLKLNSGPKLTLTCRSPAKPAQSAVPSESNGTIPCQSDPSTENVRLTVNMALPEDQKQPNSIPVTTASTNASNGDLVDKDDVPLSVTFASQSQQHRAPLTSQEAALVPDDQNKTSAAEKDNGEKDGEDYTPDETAASDSGDSWGEDIIHVRAWERPRPMTRSFSKISNQVRESVKTHFTRVSRSNSPFEGSPQPDSRSRPIQSVLSVRTLKVERPLTRAYTADVQTTHASSDSEQNSKNSKYSDEEQDLHGEDEGALPVTHSPSDAPSTEYRVPRKRAHYEVSNINSHVKHSMKSSDDDDHSSQLDTRNEELAKTSKSSEDSASAGDDVDEVLCGEDGYENWKIAAKERGKGKAEAHSQSDELLDQGQVLSDGKATGSPKRIVRKYPKFLEGSLQDMARKEQDDGTSKGLAKKQPRRLAERTNYEKKEEDPSQDVAAERKDKGVERREAEATIDGHGECGRERSLRPEGGRAGQRSAPDCTEGLSHEVEDDGAPGIKKSTEVEEETLDEGQDEGVEDDRDVTWTPPESDSCHVPQDTNDNASIKDDASLDNGACHTELGTELGTPETHSKDGEVRPETASKGMADDRRRKRRASCERKDTTIVRKSSRIQKRSRRLEESAESAAQPTKRRRMGTTTEIASPHSSNLTSSIKCTVITSAVEGGKLEDVEVTDEEAENVPKRFLLDRSHARRKSSRQNTPSRPRYAATERRVTRSSGRKTRSQSTNLRNRSLSDRLGYRRD